MTDFSIISDFKPEVIIVGAGASGLMCAARASKKGRRVVVVDHGKKPGVKILMAGGGKCNFTNYFLDAENYVSKNPHFCKSAISRFTQWDFISMVENNRIRYEEREHGQLFCKESSREILDMLLGECRKNGVLFLFGTKIENITKKNNFFQIDTKQGKLFSKSVVIASGGPSIPSSGATSFGFEVADSFNINVIEPLPALVPLTFQVEDKKRFSKLSGIAVDSIVKNSKISFRDNLLFTHKGLSGPAILKISLYFKPGETLFINLLPDNNIEKILQRERGEVNQKKIKNFIQTYLPKSLIEVIIPKSIGEKTVKSLSNKDILLIDELIHNLKIKPGGTQGLRIAEVTQGGVDCNEISSKTMESLKVKGLYFIGEVLDVTGWLGGYNLQWAWSSGWCAGEFV